MMFWQICGLHHNSETGTSYTACRDKSAFMQAMRMTAITLTVQQSIPTGLFPLHLDEGNLSADILDRPAVEAQCSFAAC